MLLSAGDARSLPDSSATEHAKVGESQALYFGSDRFARMVRELLEPARMHPLRLERLDPVAATELFHRPETIAHLREYSERYRQEQAVGFGESVHALLQHAVKAGEVPEALSHQDQVGTVAEEQARFVHQVAFLRALIDHPGTVGLRGYEKNRAFLLEMARLTRMLQAIDNLFRSRKVKAMHDTRIEAEIVERCFGAMWPPGVNLYELLGELYPAFHARMTAQIPLAAAERLDTLFDEPFDRGRAGWLVKAVVDDRGHHLGVYPVATFARDDVTREGQFVAQDQIGRKAIARRVFDDTVAILRGDPGQVVVIVDYAGGVGNLAELVGRHIYALDDGELKRRLIERVRITVLDGSQTQLAAGRARFLALSKQPGLAGLERQVFFFHHDIGDPLTTDLSRIFRPASDSRYPTRPVYLGMTSYTLGALDSEQRSDGRSWVHAVADEMFRTCYRVYAVDFSSPLWRMEDFMRDTGNAGRHFLRLVHGKPEDADRERKLNRLLAWQVKRRLGRPVHTVADYVRELSLGPGLASHLVAVWPHAYGHCSGYSVQPDSTLRMPHVLSLALRLNELGAELSYRSQVFLFLGVDIGSCAGNRRAWSFSPGWIADFVVATNPELAPHASR